jgi:hypothetical protein
MGTEKGHLTVHLPNRFDFPTLEVFSTVDTA